MFLIFGRDELRVHGYTNVNFQLDKDDNKSQSGYVFILNSEMIGWKSFKQKIAADSKTDAEYIAIFEATKKAVQINKFINELGVVSSIVNYIPLYCFNNRAIRQLKEPRSHE